MSKTEKEWYIGIDFGTSNTSICAYEATEGIIYSGELVEGISDLYSNIPTRVAVNILKKSSNEYFVGSEVESHPSLHVFKGLKDAAREVNPNNGLFGKKSIEYPYEFCGFESKLQVGTDDYPEELTPYDLLVEFFKKVLHIGMNDDYQINQKTVKKIVIGQPVCDGRKGKDGSSYEYKSILKKVLSKCFTGDESDKKFVGTDEDDGIITVVDEPQLAGVTYLYSENNDNKRKVLVIDLGGGTTDFCVLEKENVKIKYISNIGSCEKAGNAIDELIFNLLFDIARQPKSRCRTLKERLFVEDSTLGADTKIIPKTEYTKMLAPVDNYFTLCYEQVEDVSDYINLRAGKIVNKGKERDVDGNGSLENIFNEIGTALKNALIMNNITGINQVFFVGGTSIITPLRKHLINIVTACKLGNGQKCCVPEFNIDEKNRDVITMFGNNTRMLELDGDGPRPVTCYNAVAIGACILAMTYGEMKPICVKPSLILNIEGADYEKRFDTTDNNLIIKTKKGTPFAWVYFEEKELKEFKYESKYYDPGLHFYVKINYQDDRWKYTIELNQYKQSKQLAIVAMYFTDGIQFKAYSIDNNSVTNMRLADIIKQDEIIIKKEEIG